MPHKAEDVIRNLHRAFAKNDAAAIRALFSRNVVWHNPGKNKTSGDHEGADAILAVWARIQEISKGTFRAAEIHDVIGNGQHVVSLHTLEAKKRRKLYRFPEALIFHVKRGKITEVWAHPGDQYLWDEYFS